MPHVSTWRALYFTVITKRIAHGAAHRVVNEFFSVAPLTPTPPSCLHTHALRVGDFIAKINHANSCIARGRFSGRPALLAEICQGFDACPLSVLSVCGFYFVAVILHRKMCDSRAVFKYYCSTHVRTYTHTHIRHILRFAARRSASLARRTAIEYLNNSIMHLRDCPALLRH